LSLAGFAALSLAALPAAADVEFYGVTDSSLVHFDMTTHTANTVAPLTVGGGALNLLQDCDFDGSGTLWATRFGGLGGFPPTTVSEAYRIDINTGIGTLQSSYGSGAELFSLAYRSSNSTFYSINVSGGTTTGHLVTTNMTAGTVTTVAGVPHNLPGPILVDAVAFAPNGTLYGVWNSSTSPFGGLDYKLVTFNLNTGLGSVIGSIAPGLTFNSLRFDSAGTAYTVESNTGNVYTVNLATGQGTVLFAGGSTAVGIRGIGFIPAPGTTVLAGLGALFIARRRRR
jgi:hypothetical protein